MHRYPFLALVFALSAASLSAQNPFLLAGNIGDASGISAGAAATLSGNPSPFVFTSRHAIPFSVTAPIQLGAVEVTVSVLVDGAGINLYLAPSTVGGLPDDSRLMSLASVHPTTSLGSGFDQLLAQTSVFPTLQPAEIYWLVLDAAPNSVFAWNQAASGPAGYFNANETGWSPNTFSYGFNVYAVPEPGTVGAGLLAVVGIGWAWRRRP